MVDFCREGRDKDGTGTVYGIAGPERVPAAGRPLPALTSTSLGAFVAGGQLGEQEAPSPFQPFSGLTEASGAQRAGRRNACCPTGPEKESVTTEGDHLLVSPSFPSWASGRNNGPFGVILCSVLC